MKKEKEVFEEYQELFHYTNLSGLEGIIKNRTLWGTHYEYLNDRTEIKAFREVLPKIFFQKIYKIMLKNQTKSTIGSVKIDLKHGTLQNQAQNISLDIANRIYETLFEEQENSPTNIKPFITSFCNHKNHEYNTKHGLLSQWRGYAKNGISLVFDTKKITQLMRQEQDYQDYIPCIIGDVYYGNNLNEFLNIYDKSVDQILEVFLSYYRGEKVIWPDNLINDLIQMFTRFKHQAFVEEREVRIISLPPEKPFNLKKPLKGKTPISPIMLKNKPRLELFNFPNKKPIPIKRIIIGPQHNQLDVKNNVKKLIGNQKIKIFCSETPYIWPHEE